MKRAGIYIRTSREKQAEKASPQAQEADCRAYCESQGYQVVDVYRDIEKYRVGKRLVEPSGTRSDRPQMRRLLEDVKNGRIDVIIAWREDRLYRGIRPMLDVIDCIEENRIDIELVKETFDRRMAPIKASIARMELDARADRTNMGISSRLASGKVWPSTVPYGYLKNDDGMAEINPEETEWVRRIWKWAGDEISSNEIRRRLVEGGAPQRTAEKIPWQIAFIYAILRNETYYTGIQRINWDGEAYEIPYPVIIDPATAQKVKERKNKNKAFPARNLKYNYLAAGLLYCKACGVRMASTTTDAYKNGKKTGRLRRAYRCGHYTARYPSDGCAKNASVRITDQQLWDKVWKVLQSGDELERAIETRIEQLRGQEQDAQGEVDRIERELEKLMEERQWVITQGRKRTLTEKDMEYQLSVLSLQEKDLRRELSEKSLLVGNRVEKLIEATRLFRKEVAAGLDGVCREAKTPKEEELQFKARRKIVEAIVSRVNVLEDKSIEVEFEIPINGFEIKETPLSSQ